MKSRRRSDLPLTRKGHCKRRDRRDRKEYFLFSLALKIANEDKDSQAMYARAIGIMESLIPYLDTEEMGSIFPFVMSYAIEGFKQHYKSYSDNQPIDPLHELLYSLQTSRPSSETLKLLRGHLKTEKHKDVRAVIESHIKWITQPEPEEKTDETEDEDEDEEDVLDDLLDLGDLE